jgi:hypothetical protein
MWSSNSTRVTRSSASKSLAVTAEPVPRERRIAPFAIDLTRIHRRTVTSFYSNLVTRPTGRAVRLGVESQIVELTRERQICLSVLDFTQVRVLDYSCADEIVAKLLLRYAAEDRPGEAYFLAHGLADHHEEVIGEVLERHGLLLVVEAEPAGGRPRLLGTADPLQQASWQLLIERGRATASQLAGELSSAVATVAGALGRLESRRVILGDGTGYFAPLTSRFRA